MAAAQSSLTAAVVYYSVVSGVSLYDIYLTQRFAFCLREMELNPIARWIMRLDQLPPNAMPDLRVFLLLKTVGTVIVLFMIGKAISQKPTLGHSIGIGVTLFQLWLLWFLC